MFNKIKNDIENTVVGTIKSNRIMKTNELLGNKYVIGVVIVLIDIFIFVAFNVVLNLVINIFAVAGNEMKLTDYFNNENMMNMTTVIGNIKYILSYILLIIIFDVVYIYKFRVNYSMDLYNKGQKGKQRFTTIKEIKEQYRAVPEKDLRFPGNPGFIVSRQGDKLFIDDSPVNNLIIGITRSGKDETIIFPLIDEYSRAENQPSMIVTDIKLEAFPASKETLTKRGYDVYLYNLIDLMNTTLRHNPLTLVIDELKEGNVSTAELISNSLCYSIYCPKGTPSDGDAVFFAKTATQLVSAAILAHADDCLLADRKINTSKAETWHRKQAAYKKLDLVDKEKAMKIFNNYKGKLKPDEIYTIVTKVNYIPDTEQYIPTTENEKKINFYSIVNTFTSLARINISPKETLLDFYFSSRPDLDHAKFLYSSVEVAGDRTKGNVMANALSELVVFTYQDVAKITAESTMNLRDIGFGEKPVAIFVALPDFDHSKDFLLSIFNRQVYYILSREAYKEKKKKCPRWVKFIWNEFGNMPAVDEMYSMVTAGLGRNIYFDLVVQSYGQLYEKYGSNADIIKSNCGNKMYILTDEEDTADEISKRLGPETITTINRTGSKMSLNKTFTESFDDKPLLHPVELTNFREGECVLLRTMKRKDLKGNDILSYPIYNFENGTRFKFRYQYLLDSFPNDIDYLELIENELLDEIDLSERVWDYKQVFNLIPKEEDSDKKRNKVTNKTENPYEVMQYKNLKNRKTVHSILCKNMGSDYMEKFDIQEDSTIDELSEKVMRMMMDEEELNKLLQLIEKGMSK